MQATLSIRIRFYRKLGQRLASSRQGQRLWEIELTFFFMSGSKQSAPKPRMCERTLGKLPPGLAVVSSAPQITTLEGSEAY